MKKSTGPKRRISESTNVRSHLRHFHHHKNYNQERSSNARVISFNKDIIDDSIYRRVEKITKDNKVIEVRETQYFTQGSIGLKAMSKSEYMSRKNLMRNRNSNHVMFKLDLKMGRSHHSQQVQPVDATVVDSMESKPTPPLDIINWTDDPFFLSETLPPMDIGYDGLYFPHRHTEEENVEEQQNLLHLLYEEFNSPIDEYRRCNIIRATTSNKVTALA